MTTGLYFPHTMCHDKALLKSALFLFDDLEYIVPWLDYTKKNPPNDPQIRDAMELIGHPIVPTTTERKAAHEEIEQVCRGKMANKLNFRPSKKIEEYLIFPRKFDRQTWHLLRENGLTKPLGKDYRVARSLGHFMMAMLAVACSSGKKQLVTDYPDAFKSLYLATADDVYTNASNLDDVQQRLLNVRIKSFDFSKIRFSRLLDLRKNEARLLTELRKNYLETHQECLVEVENFSNNPREIDRCIERYTKKAEDDLKELKRALQVHATVNLLSKTCVSAVAGIAAEAIVPSTGFLTSSAVLTGQLVGYRDKRRDLLKKHKFAWLYEVGTKYKLY